MKTRLFFLALAVILVLLAIYALPGQAQDNGPVPMPLKIEPPPGKLVHSITIRLQDGQEHTFSVSDGLGPQTWGQFRALNLNPYDTSMRYVIVTPLTVNAPAVIAYSVTLDQRPTPAPPEENFDHQNYLPLVVNR